MDTKTGIIYQPDQIDEITRSIETTGEANVSGEIITRQDLGRRFKPMAIPPSLKQLRRGKVGRNEPCPCGSGRKFKKCCLGVW